MQPTRLRIFAFTILLIGSLGIVWFYSQIVKNINGERDTVAQIQRNYVQQILNNLRSDVEAFIDSKNDSLSYLSQLHSDGELESAGRLAIKPFERNEIDGVLLLDRNRRMLDMRGIPIKSDSFNVCLVTQSAVEGIHTCPVSGHTIMYSVIPKLKDSVHAYTVVFYKEVSDHLEQEIEAVTNFPVRFDEVDEIPADLPGFIYQSSILQNFEKRPLLQMISYYHKSILDNSRNFLITTILLIALMGMLAYITTSLSRVAILAKSLELKNKQLKEVTNQRETLLHVLSHDLNNHLTGVVGYCELVLSDSKLSETIRGYVSSVLDVARRQIHIIEMVRLQRALESGKLNMTLEPTQLGPVVDQLLEDFGVRLSEKQIEVDICPALADTVVLVEPSSFAANVLNNVFSNAIKFTRKKGTISMCVNPSRNDNLELTIEDNGIGIPVDMMEDIWNERKKTTRLGTEGEKGTGFGLPIVKKFVEAYQGSVRLDSKDIHSHPAAHGTKVTIRLKSG